MKQLLFWAACAAAFTSNAQTCFWNADLVTPTVSVGWVDGHMRADGATWAVYTPDDNLGDLLLQRLDPSGQVVLSQRYATTDPGVHLQPREVLPTADGGAVIYGVRWVLSAYTNLFAIKVDANGVKEWARIYMGMQSALFDPFTTLSPRLTMHPGGGYVYAFPSNDGVYVHRLDAQGLPLWSKHYSITSGGFARLHLIDVLVEPDEDLMLALHPADATAMPTGGPLLVHLFPNGDIDWTKRYALLGDNWTKIERASNGDFILFGQFTSTSGLMRVSETGTVLWIKGYSNSFNGDLAELPNGDILVASRMNYTVDVARWQADGTLIEAWNTNSYWLRGSAGARGDSLVFKRVALDAYYTNNTEPVLLIVPTAANMNCGFVPATLPATNPAIPAIITTDVLVAIPDVLKTWTLSLGDALELTQMDVLSAMSTGQARPGFQHPIHAQITNIFGAPTGPLSASLTVDPQVTVLNATPTPTSIVGNTLNWTGLPSLDGFNTNYSLVHVNTLIPASVPLGTVLTHTLTVITDSVDLDPANNSTSVNRTVTGSYDPNDKLVWPVDVYDLTTDSILDYTIRFQNTGTDTAFTVVLRDTLPVEVSVGSYMPGPASHPYTFDLGADGVATWTFSNILLPDSNTNEPLSHGLVSFRIKPDAGLPVGTVISNRADIFFDFNTPVRTPDATVVLTMPTLAATLGREDHLLLYPMPVHDLLTVELPRDFQPVQMRITALDGRCVGSLTLRAASGRVAFPTHDLAPGLHVLTLTDAEGRTYSTRFIKAQ